MNKFIIIFFAIFALAKGYEQHENIENYDNFLLIHRQQFDEFLKDYETKLNKFNKRHSSSVEVINQLGDLLVERITQTEQRLNPLLLLSEASKECVLKYRTSVQSVENTKDSIGACVSTVYKHLEGSLANAVKIKDDLEKYYNEDFNAAVYKCGVDCHKGTQEYNECIEGVTNNATQVRILNQKEFEYALEAAECDATAQVKKAIDCNFDIQSKTIKSITLANLMVDKCRAGEDKCEPCPEHTCSNIEYIEADYANETISNPFYGRGAETQCLMLEIH